MHLIEEITGPLLAGGLIIGASMVDVSDPVIVTVGGTLLTAIGTALKVLWDRNNTLSKTTDVALAKCEEEHKKSTAKYDIDQKLSADRVNVLIEKVISLSGEVGMMKGRIQGFQEATDKADSIARDKAAHEVAHHNA